MASPIVPQSVPNKLILPETSGLLPDHFINNYTPSPNDGKFAVDLLHALQTHAPLTLLQKFFLFVVIATPSPYFLNYFNFPNNERWYSVNSGNLHIVVLDSAFSWGSAEQLSWLASDLQSADSQSRITVVVYHHPTFTSVIDTQLINYGVDFVVSGHIHAYSKNYSNGVYFFTLPGGTSIGHALATINENSATITFYNSDGSAIETTTIDER